MLTYTARATIFLTIAVPHNGCEQQARQEVEETGVHQPALR